MLCINVLLFYVSRSVIGYKAYELKLILTCKKMFVCNFMMLLESNKNGFDICQLRGCYIQLPKSDRYCWCRWSVFTFLRYAGSLNKKRAMMALNHLPELRLALMAILFRGVEPF